MPDFNGTVRVTALVFGEDQYGGTDTRNDRARAARRRNLERRA